MSVANVTIFLDDVVVGGFEYGVRLIADNLLPSIHVRVVTLVHLY
jgi:hypothetical protein